ncbi:hypothetical protein PENARI_c030G01338 [Penicillium arizonense]|uniref:RNA polymerase Rpb1 C-terminal repeat domain-containing protein n=1 Tax=Penicillium arizonense TaxID=1835702 RepID=A0A1F5L5A8_PENAI|nr:hypothetical protein PENARI_c030G01338 [Penicillium arizonense]OGE48267.1 hypothetical protein PENARI_c030G01338 [Penicillium arizonense]
MVAGKKTKAKDKAKANAKKVKKAKSPDVPETTTNTPTPGSPELPAQETDQGPGPVIAHSPEIKTPLPVSAYEVFDDDDDEPLISDPVTSQQSPVVKTVAPVVSDPVPTQQAPVVDQQAPAIPNPVSNQQSPVTETVPLAISDSTTDQPSPKVETDKLDESVPPLGEATSFHPPADDTEAKDEEPLDDPSKEVEASEPLVSAPPADPFSPAAASVPLPSPSLTEARFMSSPSQDNYLYQPAPSAYSPYAAPIPYSSLVPYASPIPYSSPVPYNPQAAYGSPGLYASQVPYTASPVPYTSPVPYLGPPYAGSAYAGSAYAGSPYAGSPYAGSPTAYASPVPYTASPVPKVSSPLARSHYAYKSPNMSPTATPPPPSAPMAPPAPPSVAPPAPPSVAPSVAPSRSASVNSPVMSSAGAIPPYGQYSPHYSHDPHYMQRSYSIPDPSYAASYQALQNLSMAGQPGENGALSPPDSDSEHLELLQRIQSAIPDINRLLHGFRNTHSKLSTREAEIKQIGNQHEQALMHKEYYIEALQSQMKKTANQSAEEGSKLKNTINELRLELGNLQEKQKDLEDGLAVHQKSNEELTQTKVQLEGQIAQLNTDIQEAKETHEKELENQKEEQEKALVAQKQELTELFEEIKNEDEKIAAENLETRERELRSEQEAAKGEWEKERSTMQESLEAQRTELEATKTELSSKIADLESKERELGSQLSALTSTREELAAKLAELEASRKEIEELHQKHASESDGLREGHAGELDSLRKSHDEQVAAAAKDLDDKIAALEAHFHEKEQLWAEQRATLEKQLAEKNDELSSAEREKERMEGDGIIKEQHLQRAVSEMKSTIDHLDRDCDRLRKTLLSLGEATDLKSTKGDQFFLDCFNELSQLIYDLSKEHFAYLPIDPPKDILSKIPSEIPPFLDNTPASRELRCAYIQHVVSKTITYRVFQPFLFTLGRRYDKADTFFQMLSMDIRRKSVRREAFWRQQTLKAAYTTSDAKQSINVAAAVIVDEIIDHIKHFADPKHLDSLVTGVRKIVKLAAETWRHARVERELVLATFPAPDADSISNEGWLEYGVNCEHSYPQGSEPTRHVVLRTFPRIVREAAHEDFTSDQERASSCIYSQGVVLYSDSPVILARLQEFAKKKSTDTVVSDDSSTVHPKTPRPSREDLVAAAVEKLTPVVSSPPRVATIRSAPTSPGPKGQFVRG